jgi:hypothetical protein
MNTSDKLEDAIIRWVLTPSAGLSSVQKLRHRALEEINPPVVYVGVDSCRIADGFAGTDTAEYEASVQLLLVHSADDTTSASGEAMLDAIETAMLTESVQAAINVSGTGLHVYGVEQTDSSEQLDKRFWHSVLTYRIQFCRLST